MRLGRQLGCDAALLRAGYEQLRRDALGSTVAGGMMGKGLVLVLRHGMFAWMLACREYALADSNTENECEETDRYLLPQDIRYQTAVLLATMALHVRRQVRSI
jgi:hypothetical protein